MKILVGEGLTARCEETLLVMGVEDSSFIRVEESSLFGVVGSVC